MTVEFGKEYEDTISGFRGICTGYVTYITGCNQVLLTPTVGKDNLFATPQWIDESRIEDVNKSNVTKVPYKQTSGKGFSTPAPIR